MDGLKNERLFMCELVAVLQWVKGHAEALVVAVMRLEIGFAQGGWGNECKICDDIKILLGYYFEWLNFV